MEPDDSQPQTRIMPFPSSPGRLFFQPFQEETEWRQILRGIRGEPKPRPALGAAFIEMHHSRRDRQRSLALEEDDQQDGVSHRERRRTIEETDTAPTDVLHPQQI